MPLHGPSRSSLETEPLEDLIEALTSPPVPILALVTGLLLLLLAGLRVLARRLRLGTSGRVALGLAGISACILGLVLSFSPEHAPSIVESPQTAHPMPSIPAPQPTPPVPPTSEETAPTGGTLEDLRTQLRALEAQNEALSRELERLEAANREAQRRLDETGGPEPGR